MTQEEAQQDRRLADIQTSLAVLASSLKAMDSQITEIKNSLKAHMSHEEKLFAKIFDKFDKIEDRVSKAEGAVTGAKWVIGIVTAIAAFLGIKGGIQ